MPLNHPPLVNLVLRHGLPDKDHQHLSLLYEFGHFQTLPLSLAHTLALLWVSKKQRSFLRRIIWVAAMALAHQSFWEMASEGYAVAHEREAYLRTYPPPETQPADAALLGSNGRPGDLVEFVAGPQREQRAAIVVSINAQAQSGNFALFSDNQISYTIYR